MLRSYHVAYLNPPSCLMRGFFLLFIVRANPPASFELILNHQCRDTKTDKEATKPH